MAHMNRRTFLGAGAAALGLAACARGPIRRGAFELEEQTFEALAAGLRSGRWTSRQLLELYVQRIQELDSGEWKLNAIIEHNPDAARLADELDNERRQRGPRSVLHGVPIVLKDNIDTGDRMMTSAGSLALDGWHAPVDAPVAARLRAAGALILGKTNLSEWANFRSTHSSSGWSGRGGQTRNPYALNRTPSGSSSGTGSAVAANLCAAGIGSETDGSVVSPASVNGLVGIKPTLGLLPGDGIIPIAHSQDTAGPMARTVRDAAILLGIMAGKDFTKELRPDALNGARLGIARKFFDRNPKMDGFLNKQIDALKRCGAVIVDPADLPSHGKSGMEEFEVLLYEYKTDLDAYLARQPQGRPVRSMRDLIDFNEKNRVREMPHFGQEILLQSVEKGPLTEKKYLDARAACLRLSRDEGIDAVLNEHKVDAIVTLTNGPAWCIDWINGDYDTGGCSTPPAVAGYPHVTVPAGLVDGLPVGLSFFSTAWRDQRLINLAYAFEQQTKARTQPQFRIIE